MVIYFYYKKEISLTLLIATLFTITYYIHLSNTYFLVEVPYLIPQTKWHRTRQIKQYGNTFVIKLSPDDLKDLNLKVGDNVDIDDITKINFKPLPKSKEFQSDCKKEASR